MTDDTGGEGVKALQSFQVEIAARSLQATFPLPLLAKTHLAFD